MRGRKLNRKGALAEYLIYQIRTYEFLNMFHILCDLTEQQYSPEDMFPKGCRETVQNMTLGIFASFIDKHADALNVFDVWVALYPEEEKTINETWAKIKPHISLIRDYRNVVSFHASKDLGGYIRMHEEYTKKVHEIGLAMREFGELARYLILNQHKALPNFRKEIEPILRDAGVPEDKLERAVDYFIQN